MKNMLAMEEVVLMHRLDRCNIVNLLFWVYKCMTTIGASPIDIIISINMIDHSFSRSMLSFILESLSLFFANYKIRICWFSKSMNQSNCSVHQVFIHGLTPYIQSYPIFIGKDISVDIIKITGSTGTMIKKANMKAT